MAPLTRLVLSGVTVANATLWSLDTPALHVAHVAYGKDAVDVRFGLRAIAVDLAVRARMWVKMEWARLAVCV